MEARYQLRQSPMRAGLRPVHNLTDLTVEASTGLIIKVMKSAASRCAVELLQGLTPLRSAGNFTPEESPICRLRLKCKRIHQLEWRFQRFDRQPDEDDFVGPAVVALKAP